MYSGAKRPGERPATMESLVAPVYSSTVKPKKRWLRQATTWADLSIIGIQFPVAIALGYFWGRWMDRLFGTTPYLMAVFSFFGIVAGFVNLFRITAKAAREEEKLERDEKNEHRNDGDG